MVFSDDFSLFRENRSAEGSWLEIHRRSTGFTDEQIAERAQVDVAFLRLLERIDRQIAGDDLCRVILSPRTVQQLQRVLRYINAEEQLRLTLGDYFGTTVIVKEIPRG